MNYAALKAEIAGPAYAGLSDAQIAAALNAPTVDVHRDVPAREIETLLLRSTEWGKVVRTADGRRAAPEAIADICISLVTAAERGRDLASASEEDFGRLQAMAEALVDAEVLSDTIRDALLALRTVQISRAAQLGLGAVTAGDVQTAKVT